MIYVKPPYQFIGLVVIISLIIGYISVLALGNDNPTEEAPEDVIKEEIGISLELTPDPKPKLARPLIVGLHLNEALMVRCQSLHWRPYSFLSSPIFFDRLSTFQKQSRIQLHWQRLN